MSAKKKLIVFMKRNRPTINLLQATLKKENQYDNFSVPMLRAEDLFRDKVTQTVH